MNIVSSLYYYFFLNKYTIKFKRFIKLFCMILLYNLIKDTLLFSEKKIYFHHHFKRFGLYPHCPILFSPYSSILVFILFLFFLNEAIPLKELQTQNESKKIVFCSGNPYPSVTDLDLYLIDRWFLKNKTKQKNKGTKISLKKEERTNFQTKKVHNQLLKLSPIKIVWD